MLDHVPPALLSRLPGAVFLFWCVAWPLMLAWGAVNGDVVLAVFSIVVLVLTPYIARRWSRSNYLLERRLHALCHQDFHKCVARLAARHGFQLHETAAGELEIFADTLRAVPPGYLLDAQVLAVRVDQRVAHLRKTAPNPPELDLRELVAPDGDG